jgi:hypothetical protein
VCRRYAAVRDYRKRTGGSEGCTFFTPGYSNYAANAAKRITPQIENAKGPGDCFAVISPAGKHCYNRG